jgi:hypothetical protein
MKPLVRHSIPSDAEPLSNKLREADVRELQALGVEPHAALKAGLEHPDACFTVLNGDAVVAMFGVAPYPSDPLVGVPWLLASDDFLRLFTKPFIRRCKAYVNYMNALYPTLINWTDSRNTAAIRWLYWCGFKFLNVVPPPNNPDGLFIPFVRYKSNV